MEIQLRKAAAIAGGYVIGDPDRLVHGVNPPADAQMGEVTLLDHPDRWGAVCGTAATAIVTSAPIDASADAPIAQIVVPNPHQGFGRLVSAFRPPILNYRPGSGIAASAVVDPTAVVHPTAVIGDEVTIGPGTQIHPGVVVMPRSVIGEDCVLHANVTLYPYVRLDRGVVIHAGSVLGANGFGYRQENGRHVPTAQLGYVHVEDDVEIGAGVTIDRGTYGATRIGRGTKIDNQVMIAHNCRIGRHNLICSQVGVAGSCRTGDYVILAGQVGLKDHIRLGDHTIVGAQAGVMEDCAGNEVLLGSPATAQRDQMQIMAVQRRLPEMRRELKTLRREIDALRAALQQAAPPATTQPAATDGGRPHPVVTPAAA